MVVDPPAFAKHRDALDNALRAYRRLNASAIGKIASGGMLFTYSCSQAVDRRTFELTVFSAAAQTGRRVRILRSSRPLPRQAAGCGYCAGLLSRLIIRSAFIIPRGTISRDFCSMSNKQSSYARDTSFPSGQGSQISGVAAADTFPTRPI